MIFVLYILILSSITHDSRAVKPDYELYDVDRVEEYFEKFKNDFGKEYESKAENKKRLEIFKANLILINKLNQEDDTATFGINNFSDLTLDEVHQRYTGARYNASVEKVNFVRGPEAPESLDWREYNVVTPVKNQGHCGSCYVFSAIGDIEGQYAMKHKHLVELSEQEGLDCNPSGCDGGMTDDVMNYLAQVGGAMAESDYPPYSGQKETCRADSDQAVAKVIGGQVLNIADEEELKNSLANHGPMSVCVLVSKTFFNYHGGVFKGTDCEGSTLHHAVLLVGYGMENGIPYWIIKNSWGPSFGEEGYMRLIRGRNACNILDYIAQSKVY